MRAVFAIAATLIGIATSPIAAAAPQPTRVSAEYRINGFRSARFGMSPADVELAATADLKVLKAGLQTVDVPAEGTSAIVAGVVRLDPGPTPAMVSYIFGARSRKLVQVVVQWAYPVGASPRQRQSIAEAGARLARYFREQRVQPVRSDTGGVAGPNEVVLYRAWDARGASIMLSASGIAFERIIDGQKLPAAMPEGPAVLRLAYALDADRPDILENAPN